MLYDTEPIQIEEITFEPGKMKEVLKDFVKSSKINILNYKTYTSNEPAFEYIKRFHPNPESRIYWEVLPLWELYKEIIPDLVVEMGAIDEPDWKAIIDIWSNEQTPIGDMVNKFFDSKLLSVDDNEKVLESITNFIMLKLHIPNQYREPILLLVVHEFRKHIVDDDDDDDNI